MNNSLKIISLLMAFVAISTVIFVVLIIAYGASVGNIPSPSSDPDVFFAYFTNSIGISIGLVGTSLAIILAFNALRATEIQTTTVALQEFRGEIDEFVIISNKLFDQFLEILLKSAHWANAANLLTLTYHSHKENGDANFQADEEAQGGEDFSLGTVEEYHTGIIENFKEKRKDFKASINKFHDLLSGDGNIFVRLMIMKTLEKERDLLNSIKKELSNSGSTSYLELWTVNEVKSNLSVLATLENLADMPALHSINYGPTYEDFLSEDMLNNGIANFIESGGVLGIRDFDSIASHLSNYLPVLAAFGDYDHHPIAHNAEGYEISEYNLLVDDFPVFDRIDDVLIKNQNSIKVYKKILPLYASLINPESGLEAMRDYFTKFGAKKDVLKLFIDTHAARLSYNYRREAQMFDKNE